MTRTTPEPAECALHMRRSSPYTPSRACRRQQPIDHLSQRQQVLGAKTTSTSRDGHEHVGFCQIGPLGGHRGQRSVVEEEEDSVLLPGVTH